MNWKIFAASTLLAGLMALPQAAHAQGVAYPNEASRDLGECIALSTTGRDRLVTARWFATSLGMAPQLSDAVKVEPAAKEQSDRDMAALFTRLFTVDCADEARVLMANRDQAGIQAAGGRLGQIAMQDLMSDPKVLESMISYLAYIDPTAIDALAQ